MRGVIVKVKVKVIVEGDLVCEVEIMFVLLDLFK